MHKVAGPSDITLPVVAIVVGIFAWRSLKQHQAQLQAEANAAIPGPLRPAAAS